ncbi:MAG TPA: tail fiber domain-containing protein [Thermoanaerobaculia bacterium]|nr:tail fiber domain-containing protein [Thermoanaerobaculia bacterium]
MIADERSGPVGKMTVSAAAVDWQSSASWDRLVLVIGTPDGATITREFQGSRATFRVGDLAPRLSTEGTYTYELRAVPKISDEVKQRLAAARAADDDAAIEKIRKEAGIGEPVVQSGAFTILNGGFVTGGTEAPAKGPKVMTNAATTPGKLNPAPNDIVQADDVIIQGSLCVGLDCVVNESFGFDTIRLKENNTRIKFQDTSTSSGFPNNNWQLTANDSNSGGANKFSIDDITNSKTPFTTIANAPTNSLFIASTGKVGFGNGAPGLNLHITATDTPAIRQEQTNGGGFTAQTWDIGANEANWFVRDVTGGSRLPLRIRPGAPTSSIDISASGKVGVGTASPSEALHILNSGNVRTFVVSSSNQTAGLNMEVDNGASVGFGIVRTENNGDLDMFTGTSGGTAAEHVRITVGGNVGVNCNAPTFAFMIGSGSGCSTPTSGINPGSTSFTTASSRTFKENITPITKDDILDKIANVGVYNYDFINGPKDRLGLIAEDFHTVFERGSDKYIDGQDIQMALWLAVQKLTAQNKELTDRLATLEKELQKKQ